MTRCLILFAISILWIGCKTDTFQIPESYSSQKSLVEDQAMVVSAHPIASEVGKIILQQGGNAVDAAIATQFALAVVYPGAGNIGGGGFMIYRPESGDEVFALDYRERAPGKASRDMYLDSLGNPTDRSRIGHQAAGVPGTVAGLFESHKKFGKLPMKQLIQPAIQIAEKGFQITKSEATYLNEKSENFKQVNTQEHAFLKDSPWETNDLLVQPDLASTLKRIQKRGSAGFYEGETANLIVEEMKRGDGLITLQDLKDYQAVWRDPIEITYKEYTIHSMPLPSSGGLVMAQMLEMIEPFNIDTMDFHSPEAIHLMVEAERRAYADRAAYMGDTDHFTVDWKKLKDSTYASEKMKSFNPEQVTSSLDFQVDDIPIAESEETTHLSIVDKDGNAVSVTTTLNSSYGSKVVVGGAGFFLNNEMDDFSAKPGVPNLYGLVGGEANAIKPGKRMLSSMTPTIVEKNDSLFLVVGTPGGSMIITSVFQVFLNVAAFDLSLEEAVQNSRFHHQWLPDQIYVEDEAFAGPIRAALEAKGHVIVDRGPISRVEAIQIKENGQLHGVADRRGDDSAAGF